MRGRVMGDDALSTINDQDAWMGTGMGDGDWRGNRMTWQATEHDILALCPPTSLLSPPLVMLPIYLVQNCFDL